MIEPQPVGKLVRVHWRDCFSHCEQPWYTKEELDKLTTGHVEIETVGWVFKDDGEYLTVTMSKGDGSEEDNGDVGMAITIPVAMIKSIYQLTSDFN